MTIYRINLEEQLTDGTEATRVFLLDYSGMRLIEGYGTPEARLVTRKTEISLMGEVVRKDPEKEIKYPSGYRILDSTIVQEVSMDPSEFEDLVRELSGEAQTQD